jgi:predicted small metal-binding protein
MRTILLSLFTLAFAFSWTTVAQDDAEKMMKKEEKKMAMKSVSCDPSCGFSVRSHDEKELVSIVQTHAKQHHEMDMSEADVKKMMKDEMMVKKEVKMEKMEKKEMKEGSGEDDD